MSSQVYQAQLRESIERLRDPLRLRVAITLVMSALAYFAIFVPLNGEIGKAKRQLGEEKRREVVTDELELLRADHDAFRERLVQGSDVNEWVQYVLNGVRSLPLTLLNLDIVGTDSVGQYQAVTLRLEVSGDVEHLDSLLHWLETNDRLFRIDTMRMAPARGEAGYRTLQLKLSGLKA